MESLKIPTTFQHIIDGAAMNDVVAQLDHFAALSRAYGPNDSFQIGPDLDQELRRQSMSYLTVADAAASVRSIVDGLKNALDSVTALAEMHTREAYDDSTELSLPYEIGNKSQLKLGKATESVIKSTVESYDVVLEIKSLLLGAEGVLGKLSANERSWLQRSIMLRTMVEREISFRSSPDNYTAAREALHRERQSSP